MSHIDYTKIPQVRLTYNQTVHPSERVKITNSEKVNSFLVAEKAFRHFWDDGTIDFVEEFKFLLLDRSNCVLGICEFFKGGISGTVADVRMILQAALLSSCSGIILAHNHPSNNLQPSGPDKDVTKKVKEALKLFDIALLDHLILGRYGYFSFADEGIL